MFGKTVFITILAIGTVAKCQEVNDEIKDTIKRFCERNGAGDSEILAAQTALPNFMSCVRSFTETLPKVPSTDTAAVSKLMCGKTPELKTCIASLKTDISPCLPNDLRYMTNLTANGYYELIDYQCENDGQRAADYLASNSSQCFKSKGKEVSSCAKNIFPNFSWKTVQDLADLGATERCTKLEELNTCLNPLGECPGEFVEFAIKKVRNVLIESCKDVPKSARR